MRIVVESGSHTLLNAGDVAMLRVCVERLGEVFPGARIDVLTTNPARLVKLFPGAVALPAVGRYRWLEEAGHEDRPFAGPRRRAAVRLVRTARARVPPAARALLRAEAALRHGVDWSGFVRAVARADLFVFAGRGGLTDAFPNEVMATVAELRLAAELRTPVAMLSQGVGPLERATLRTATREVLHRARLVTLRESLLGPRLLTALGLSADRLRITGDDALELAWRARPEQQADGVLGVSLRAAPYYGNVRARHRWFSRALTAVRERLGCELAPVPISRVPHEDDSRLLTGLLGAEVGDPDPIEMAGRCRVVLAGTYHAAVFALAQGVPAVGLARTPYLCNKLRGLADLFPCGALTLVRPDDADALVRAVERAWTAAPLLRKPLTEAARRQVEAASRAYAELPALVSP